MLPLIAGSRIADNGRKEEIMKKQLDNSLIVSVQIKHVVRFHAEIVVL